MFHAAKNRQAEFASMKVQEPLRKNDYIAGAIVLLYDLMCLVYLKNPTHLIFLSA